MDPLKKGVEADRKRNKSEIQKTGWGVDKCRGTRFVEIIQGWCFKGV